MLLHTLEETVSQYFFVVLFAPLFAGILANLKARVESRKGPGILQPYHDLAKLIRKETVIPQPSGNIFKYSPYLLFGMYSLIALIGFGTKVGVFPVHTWLPDAHSEAPSPVSAMFSGVLLPVALYAMYRVYQIDPFPALYVWFGIISIAAVSICLGYQRRYKRMFAYSTMENRYDYEYQIQKEVIGQVHVRFVFYAAFPGVFHCVCRLSRRSDTVLPGGICEDAGSNGLREQLFGYGRLPRHVFQLSFRGDAHNRITVP